MTSRQILPMVILLAFAPACFAGAQTGNKPKKQINIRERDFYYKLSEIEIEKLLRDTNNIIRIYNSDSTGLIMSSFPPVVVRDIAFKIAGVVKVLNQQSLDQLDKDLIYIYAKNGEYDKLKEKYSFLSTALAEKLRKVAVRIVTG